MVHRLALVLTVSLLGPTLFAQVTTTEHLNFPRAATIRFTGSLGDLNVDGWDRAEVEITVTKSLPYGYKSKQPDEAKKRLDAVKVTAENKSGNELVISTMLPAHRSLLWPFAPHRTTDGVTLEYEVHVPRDSKLAIHHGTGFVSVTGVNADIEASAGRGDIILMLPDTGSYAFDAKSDFGTVTSDFEGTPHVRRYRVGERYATKDSSSPRKIHLRMGFGGITIKAVPKEAYAKSGV